MKMPSLASAACLLVLFARGAHAQFVSVNGCQGGSSFQTTIGRNKNYTLPLGACVPPLDTGYGSNQWDTSMKAVMKDDTTVQMTFYYAGAAEQGADCTGNQETRECICGNCCTFTVGDADDYSIQIDCVNQNSTVETMKTSYYDDASCSNKIGEDAFIVGCTGGRGDSADRSSTEIVMAGNVANVKIFDGDTACGFGSSSREDDIVKTLECTVGACCEHSRSSDNDFYHPFLNPEDQVLYIKFEAPITAASETSGSSAARYLGKPSITSLVCAWLSAPLLSSLLVLVYF